MNLDTHFVILTNLESLQATLCSMDGCDKRLHNENASWIAAYGVRESTSMWKNKAAFTPNPTLQRKYSVSIHFQLDPCSLGVVLINTLLLTCPMKAASTHKPIFFYTDIVSFYPRPYKSVWKNISIHTTLKALKQVRQTTWWEYPITCSEFVFHWLWDSSCCLKLRVKSENKLRRVRIKGDPCLWSDDDVQLLLSIRF